MARRTTKTAALALANKTARMIWAIMSSGEAYRDFSLILFDNDTVIGANTVPYPTAVDGPALVNYRSEPRPSDAGIGFAGRLITYPTPPTSNHALANSAAG